jgi:amino acid adenylation domain-containing protein
MSVDAEAEAVGRESAANLPGRATTGDVVYVIYTSGSTGQPKGVKIAHRSLVNYTWWARETYLKGESLSFALYSSLAFDLTVTSIFVPLVAGASVVVHNWEGREAPLNKILRDGRTGVLKLTPSHLSLIKEWDNRGSNVRSLIVGGEALGTELARQVHESFGGEIAIYNEYGPTEATVGCMIHLFDAGAENRGVVPIGRPAANMRVYVLDARLNPVAENVIGELYIAGDGLAESYLNRPELTAERFIADPFHTGARMYRTGDLARRLSGGELEYLGRRDDQVKFHGYRVELNEIQWALKRHPQIRDSVVLITKDKNGHDVMVAYYVSRQELEVGELRASLSEVLIEETIPNVFVHLRKLPLTLNGKVNRDALPTLDEAKQKLSRAYAPPQTPTEEILAGIWAEVLGVNRVGVGDNFFELGGHSLLATRVVSRVREAFGIELALRLVFETQTVAGLGAKIDAASGSEHPAAASPVGRAPRDERLPLSFAQQRLWFLDQLDPGSAAYNIPAVLRLRGALDAPALERTLTEIVRRHETLRTNFSLAGDEPVQIIREAEPARFETADFGALPVAEREAAVESFIRARAQKPFDLSQDSLLRASLLRLADEDHILLLTMHHIVSDGWSTGVLIKEMATLYGTFSAGEESPLEELAIQYADFAKWQRGWLQGPRLEEQLAYWRGQLADAPATLQMPTDRPRPPVQTFESAAETFLLPESLSAALKSLSRREGVTLFMTLLAAYHALLHRYTQQEDILVGTAIANRNRAEIENLIGFFVNMLVMRADLRGNPRFVELLRRVRETAFEAYAHQDLPFEKLVEELQPERDLSHTPFFQVTFVLQNASPDALRLPGLEVSHEEFGTGVAKFDLVLAMTDDERGLGGTLQYNKNLFDASTIRRLLDHFRSLLEGVAAAPELRIDALPLLTAGEREEMLVAWNQTAADYPSDSCVHEMFERHAGRTPEKVAAVFEGQQLTYAGLNRRANRLARHLRRLGVGPETLVGLCVERSAEMLISLLAIHKAGGAYVPLDPSYPRERLRFMLEDSRVSVLLTRQELLGSLPAHAAKVVRLDADADAIARESEENPSVAVAPENLAYVIYTSGSTGKPKGVLVQHRGLSNLTEAQLASFRIQSDARVLQFASFSFDASIFEIVMALRSGATLVLATRDSSLPGPPLMKLLREQAITDVTLPPSVLAVLPEEPLPELRTVIVAGEACPVDLVKRWGVGRRFFNAYGPTESTVWATVSECAPDGHAPTIGRPIINTRIHVLDARLRPVPVGVPGELHIGGVGLARGYLNNPDLTAERFVPDPFSAEPGARLYRTGDLARYLSGGEIDFLGRIDSQVKVRGFRIEPGEIEAALRRCSGVREASVIAKSGGVGNVRLVAFVAADAATPPTVADLRAGLKDALPDYMLPASFVVLETLPLTANGKVDRRALERLDDEGVAAPGVSSVAPRDAAEQVIAGVWQEALQVEKVGIDDNFFDLGGHSLLIVNVHTKLKGLFEKEVPMADMFKYPTVRLLAGRFSENQNKQPSTQGIRDRAKRQKEAALRKMQAVKQGAKKTRPGDAG